MKKFYPCFVSVFLLSSIVNAQFIKGQNVIGGNFSLSSNKLNLRVADVNISKSDMASINPTFGKFVKPNKLIGFGLNYGYYYNRSTSDNFQSYQKSSGNSFGASVFTQNFFPISDKLFFTMLLKANSDYNYGNSNYTNQAYTFKNKGFSIAVSVAPGLTYRLTNRWLIDGYLNNLFLASYSYNRQQSPSDKVIANNFGLSSSLTNLTNGNLALGFRYLLRN